VFADVQRIHPEENRPRGDAVSMARGVQTLRERFERPLLVLLGVVGVLLLIACCNNGGAVVGIPAALAASSLVRRGAGASGGQGRSHGRPAQRVKRSTA